MPADRDVFDYYIHTVERQLPGSEWCPAGIGADQITLNEWAVAANGHARMGREDNVRLDRNHLAPSNRALVKRLVHICTKQKWLVETPAEARKLLRLNAEQG